MVGTLMVLNPRARKRRSGGRSGPRKMSALQAKYFGKRKSAAPRRRKGSKRGKEKVIIVAANPRPKRRKVATMSRKRRHARKSTVRNFRRNPIARRRFRRNPISAKGFLNSTLVPAAVGAAGAVLVDLAIGNLPLPTSMKSGSMLPIVRIGAALLVGAAVSMVAGPAAGGEAAAGGVIVTVYGLAKNALATSMPNVRMARYVPQAKLGNFRKGRRLQRFVPMRGVGKGPRRNFRRLNRIKGMGVNRNKAGLGFVNPARTGHGSIAMSRGLMRYIATK